MPDGGAVVVKRKGGKTGLDSRWGEIAPISLLAEPGAPAMVLAL